MIRLIKTLTLFCVVVMISTNIQVVSAQSNCPTNYDHVNYGFTTDPTAPILDGTHPAHIGDSHLNQIGLGGMYHSTYQ
jgi:hypothetical protein